MKILFKCIIAAFLIEGILSISSCEKEQDIQPTPPTKPLASHTWNKWFFSATNPFPQPSQDSTVKFWVMAYNTAFRCNNVWKGSDGYPGRSVNDGRYSYNETAIGVPVKVEEECRTQMLETGAEYMLFVEAYPGTYDYDESYKTLMFPDTMTIITWPQGDTLTFQ